MDEIENSMFFGIGSLRGSESVDDNYVSVDL